MASFGNYFVARYSGVLFANIADNTPYKIEYVFEVAVILLRDSEVESCFFPTVVIVGDPGGKVTLDSSKIFHTILAGFDGIVAKIFGDHRRIDNAHLLWHIAQIGIFDSFIGHRFDSLGFAV